MNKRILAMLMALAMLVSMVPMGAMAEEVKCTGKYHDILVNDGLHSPCPDCGVDDAGCEKCYGSEPEEPKDDDTSDDAPVEDKCTGKYHDILVSDGFHSPCPECKADDPDCETCYGSEDDDTSDDAPEQPAHKCMAETKAVANKDGLSHSIVCAECNEFWKNEAHNWEDGVCVDCGFETPFSTNPEKPEEDKCTDKYHDILVNDGFVSPCPTCGADDESVAHKCMAETKAVDKGDLTHNVLCAECGKFWKNEGHNYEVTKETSKYTKYTCEDCGDSYVEYKHDHKPDDQPHDKPNQDKPHNKPSWRPSIGSSLSSVYDNVPKTGNILSLILSFFRF